MAKPDDSSRGSPEDGLKRKLREFFSKSTAVGAVRPLIRKLGAEAAKEAKKWIKGGNILRHPAGEYVFGMIGGWIDEIANTMEGKDAQIFMENASDFVDSFAGEFYGRRKGEEDTAEREPTRAEVDAFLKEIIGKHSGELMGDNLRLLLETPPEKREEVYEHLDERTRKFWELVHLALYGPEKKPEQEKPKVPFSSERVDRFNEVMERELGPVTRCLGEKIKQMDERTKARQEKQRHAAAKQPSKMDKILKKLSRVLF